MGFYLPPRFGVGIVSYPKLVVDIILVSPQVSAVAITTLRWGGGLEHVDEPMAGSTLARH